MLFVVPAADEEAVVGACAVGVVAAAAVELHAAAGDKWMPQQPRRPWNFPAEFVSF